MVWYCQSGHENPDPDYSAETYWCELAPCTGYKEDNQTLGPWGGDTDVVASDPEPKPAGNGTGSCPGPHVSDSKYRIDETKGTVKKTTPGGKLHVFALPKNQTNQKDRPLMPKFLIEKKDDKRLTDYPGTTKKVHTAFVEPLKKMLDAMKCEGERIDDLSLKNVTIKSAWRDPAKGGPPYLAALKRYLKQHKDCHQNGKKCVAPPKWTTRCKPGFEKLTFPKSMEKEAKSALGRTSSTKFKTFQTNLGKAGGGWTKAFAEYFLGQAGGWKAPAGGSNHHSGLVVDLDWPIYHGKGQVQLGTDTDRNESGRKSGAGVWLHQHAASFGFKSYNEFKEIWHMEWVEWKGTDAEPK